MTITYSLDVAKTRFCGFAKLLARWKGSIYKILWKEFLIFCLGYTVISITYRCILTQKQREVFEKVVLFVDSLIDLIPLSFVLGFYVSLVVGRWWAQYDAIPWPDRLCLMIASYVHGADERSRMIRRTLGRYLILLQALAFQAVSTSVKRRFPTTQHLVIAGIMTKEEQAVYDSVSFVYGKWWMPCQWFSSLLMRAKKEGRIKDSILLDGLFRELLIYRTSCGTMLSYDWISVPLVYTQVVTLATYMYATALIIGRQYLDTSKGYHKHQVDLYIPLFTIMQFFFYVGWLKVAEQIINPYGEDDDDFELNWCVDRTVHIVYLIVDHLQTKHPKVRKDYFWDEMEPKLPQTKHSAKGIENPQLGSAFNLEVSEAEYLPMDTVLEQDKDENMYTSDSLRRRSTSVFRSSFLMRILNPGFGSYRKKSIQKDEMLKSPSQLRSYYNPALASNNEKSGPSTPAASRKSSFRSFVKRASPSQSRTSSISLHPGSVKLRRYKSYEQQEAGKTPPNVNDIVSEIVRASTLENGQANPDVVVPMEHLENVTSQNEDKNSNAESEIGGPRLEILMPPIPEEPSRASITSIECTTPEDREVALEIGGVQNLVKEANEVLKELNRTISSQGHHQDCELKGYESCCSFSSDVSSDESVHNSNEMKQNGCKSSELETASKHDDASGKASVTGNSSV